MRLLRSGLGLALVGGALFGVLGCAEDNEKEAKITSVPGGGLGANAPVDQKAYYEQQQKNNPYGAGYPGASNAPK